MPPGETGEARPWQIIAETALALLALASCWPLVLGARHWAWFIAPVALGVALAVLMARKWLRLRAGVEHLPPPGAVHHPEGTPHGRKLTSAPPAGKS